MIKPSPKKQYHKAVTAVWLGFSLAAVTTYLLSSPTYVKADESKREVIKVEVKEVLTPTPTVAPMPTKALVTAYSCGGLETEEDIMMNCPSLKNHPGGRTANGTTPVPYKTMACDASNMGRTFELEGIGEVVCTDTGGAILGAGRFDLYVTTRDEALKFGRQVINYQLK